MEGELVGVASLPLISIALTGISIGRERAVGTVV
jgi:hypothetical protein